MKRKRDKIVPVNLICGPLGVGKTTTINHLLAQRPKDERWAVLVNEYGLVGLDAAFMASDAAERAPGQPAGVEIREVAGGCICCSAGIFFEISLVFLLQSRPDRLLIEPTGLAALSGILDTLNRPGIREAIDVRSSVCLVDPSRLEKDLAREELKDQIEAADLILANRSDLASAEQIQTFQSWAESLFPPKRYIGQIANGAIPLEFLDLVTRRETAPSQGGYRHGTDHNHDEHHHHHSNASDAESPEFVQLDCDSSHPIMHRSHRSSVASTVGWLCWEGLVFDGDRSKCWMGQLAELPGVRRIKAVLKTNKGWMAFNFVDGAQDSRVSGYRGDSRLEIIIEGDNFPDLEILEQGLRACLFSSTDGLSADSLPKAPNWNARVR